jgi:hypothetical protein
VEARVLRLEAQVKGLQESLKNALSTERVYSIKANGQPDTCLSSGSADASAAKTEVFVGKCGAANQRNWKLQPAQPQLSAQRFSFPARTTLISGPQMSQAPQKPQARKPRIRCASCGVIALIAASL